ncbi:DUF2125 domain-containing protein [Bradyrhizobium sp.]|uniref:DUF2125 domain-containing protein n=1 Tax=Bradyrhizobium sp. TaxID=376 RepID=UPI001ED5B13F|nr:DUF2125 domain-containing protein [Bradyrhizobium sp.]MBV9981497.1 DUF2125 domain-containing protein [Bradyrhizobium sp.]
MSVNVPAPRRHARWPIFIAPVLLLIVAVAWSAFWFYAASQVDVVTDAWRAKEAKAGRVYDCGRRSVAGFPFRLEVRCDDVSVQLISQTADRTANATPITAKLGEILVIAQVYDPKLVIAEFSAPATISDPGGAASYVANWSNGRSSVVGLPGVPQRASIVFEDPTLDRVDRSARQALAGAKHVELHGRQVEGAPPDRPVVEAVLEIASGRILEQHPLLATPFEADIHTTVSGLKDLSPRPWPERFRMIQAAGGHLDIVQSRVQQGEVIAVATGTLGLSPSGSLDGELQMTVAGLEKIVPALGIDKMLEQGVPQATLDRVAPGVKSQDINKLMGALDRALPGLGNVVRQNATIGVAAGLNAIGKEAVLEGRKARTFPLRFADGAVYFGPFKVAQIPPLF